MADLFKKADVGERLKTAMDEAGVGQGAIADLVDVTPQAVSGWTKTGRIDRDHLPAVCDRLNITIDWLLTGREPKRPIKVVEITSEVDLDYRRVPVISYEQAGAIREMPDNYTVADRLETIGVDSDLARQLGPHAFALVVSGDAMLPDFKPGDIVIIDPSPNVKPGDVVAAKVGDKPAILRRYRDRGEDSSGRHIFELAPTNDAYPILLINSSTTGKIIGPVVEHRRKLR